MTMDVGFYSAKIQAQVMRYREDIEYAYDRFPDTTRFWALVDLVDSSNYRILHGPGKGYIRGETFLALVRNVVTPYSEIEVLKEIGDAVLLSAESLRPLLESLILTDQVATEMALLTGDEQFAFAIRGGVSYGPVKKLNRPHKDFLGSPLDQLARILGLREVGANLFLHEAAYRTQEEIVREYKNFLSVSESKMLTKKESKSMLEPVYYRELRVDRVALREFRKHFFVWREAR
jgi:hypothetical protein